MKKDLPKWYVFFHGHYSGENLRFISDEMVRWREKLAEPYQEYTLNE